MIYLNKILKHIRTTKQYRTDIIAAALDIGISTLRAREKTLHNISLSEMTQWLGVLDIPEREHRYYLQKYKRELILKSLSEVVEGPERLLHRIADILAFQEDIDLTTLDTQLMAYTLKHVERAPKSYEAALEEVIEAEK